MTGAHDDHVDTQVYQDMVTEDYKELSRRYEAFRKAARYSLAFRTTFQSWLVSLPVLFIIFSVLPKLTSYHPLPTVLLLVYAGVVACWFLNEGLLIGHARALGLRWEGGFRGVLNLTPDKPFSTRL